MEILFEKDKKVLVTGGAGFIGSALVRKLLINNNCQIFNLDKLGYSSDHSSIESILSKAKSSDRDRYKLIKLNLINQKDLKEAIFSIKPDVIFHLAAETHVDRSIDFPKDFINSNIIGTFNLLMAVKEFLENIPIKKRNSFKFHHISTDEVFGSLGHEGYFTELSRYQPRSPYSASKAASDHLVSAWHHTYGLPTIITNCSNNYGPWQFPEKLLPVVINKALSKQTIPMYGNGLNRRDWLYVEDHIEAILLASSKGKIGDTFCIGGGEEKTNKEVIFQTCEFLEKYLDLDYSCTNLIRNVEDRPGHDFRYSIDSSYAKKELGWFPRHTFKEGLYKTIEWYVKNQDWTKKVLKNANYNISRMGLINK
tara:strand:- start:7435 stop:8532 length:1098 start_codon:yes stop_codon:yes gene_type:complete